MRDITLLVLLLVTLGSAASGKYYSNTNDYYLLFKFNYAPVLYYLLVTGFVCIWQKPTWSNHPAVSCY